jgi:hypothetical protein
MKTQTSFQQSLRVGMWTILIAVVILMCPQPPITETTVVEEIALPLATKYIQGRYQPPPKNPEKPLEGVRVLITGPTSGIGRGLATVLSQMGAEVIGLGRSESKLRQMMRMVDDSDNDNDNDNDEKHNNNILQGYHVADMADLHSVAAAANQILERYDRIDMLIANAGVHYHWTTTGSTPATEQGLDLVFGGTYGIINSRAGGGGTWLYVCILFVYYCYYYYYYYFIQYCMMSAVQCSAVCKPSHPLTARVV